MVPSQKENHYLAKQAGSTLQYYNREITLRPHPLGTILEMPEGPPNQKKLHYEAKKKGSETRNAKKTNDKPRIRKSIKKAKLLEELLYLTQVSTQISQRNEYLIRKLELLDNKPSIKKQLKF
jgi:hypothetical protein